MPLDDGLARELASVACEDRFAGVEELEARTRAIVERAAAAGVMAVSELIGRSRAGRELTCVTVGSGPRHAVVFGLPHPNEPIGGLTSLHLLERLIDVNPFELLDEFTWHVVPCIDPDGLALNEGWLAGPHTMAHYARHFYRPAGDEQVEWTAPFHYKRAHFDAVLPETQALLQLIDRTAPALMCSLHNSELGGTYFYLSRPEPELYASLQAIPQSLGLGLHAGEPEAAFIETLAEGIFLWPASTEGYDWSEKMGQDPLTFPSGSSSIEWAGRHGTLSIVSELPYWQDPDASDQSVSDAHLGRTLAWQADQIAELAALMSESLTVIPEGWLSGSPLLRATVYFTKAMDAVENIARRRSGMPENDRLATVAEQHSSFDLVDSFRLRYAGMLRRGLDEHASDPAGTPGIDEAHQRVAQAHDRWLHEAEARSAATPLPVSDLVATQYGAILVAARHLVATGGHAATVEDHGQGPGTDSA